MKETIMFLPFYYLNRVDLVKMKKLFLLSHCRGISNQMILKLIRTDPTLQIIDELNDYHFNHYFKLSREKIKLFRTDYESINIDYLKKKYENEHIHFLSLTSPFYPNLLKQITDPPPFLFYKGNLNLFEKKKIISVVGTRTPSKYGEETVEKLISPLVKEDWVIVSGLAKGIDTFAHQSAMKHNGQTIAVIGGGFYHLYPKENIRLSEEISEKHLILSEFPPTITPQKWHFPMRNRIISGLSLGTIIIQAKKRSGSLITAQLALEQNREVFAVPGSIFDPNYEGTNELIQQGAKLIMKADDIIEEFERKI